VFDKNVKVPLQEAELIGTSSSNNSNVCCCHLYILHTLFFISAIIELNTSKGGIILNVFVVGDAPSAFNTTSLSLAIGVHDLYMRLFVIKQSSPTGLTPRRNSKAQLAGQPIKVVTK
jgi:hypothetical protein